jgi:hypothetical protein
MYGNPYVDLTPCHTYAMHVRATCLDTCCLLLQVNMSPRVMHTTTTRKAPCCVSQTRTPARQGSSNSLPSVSRALMATLPATTRGNPLAVRTWRLHHLCRLAGACASSGVAAGDVHNWRASSWYGDVRCMSPVPDMHHASCTPHSRVRPGGLQVRGRTPDPMRTRHARAVL